MSDKPSLLPPNATLQELAIEQATARIEDVPIPIKSMWNPDTCPAELLPWLAWAFSVDRWKANWSVTQKRQMIKNSIFIHRHKGTIGAVKRALASLDYDAKITEWFDSEEDPYTFRIDVNVSESGIDEQAYTDIEQVVNDAKNVRSHLTSILVAGKVSGAIKIAQIMTDGVTTSVYPNVITEVEVSSNLTTLAGQYAADTVTIH
jgi:phage tail P2-like protein